MSRTTPLTILSGIPPGDSGTGRMMRHLIDVARRSDQPVNCLYRQRPASIRQLLRQRRVLSACAKMAKAQYRRIRFERQCRTLLKKPSGNLLLIHPQTLGFELTNRLLKTWPAGRLFIYILDSSYFCVRSYNHIPGEAAPCLRCLGGEFSARRTQGCAPFPVPNPHASDYTRDLLAAVRAGRVRFLSQNETQSRFVKSHFGSGTPVDIVGLWGEEWTDPFEKFEAVMRGSKVGALEAIGVDPNRPCFVIHSFYVPAKGAAWFLDLARLRPQYQFICPFPKPKAVEDNHPNVMFRPMTWESGLRDVMLEATATMVPSLWSTPIEGAMVKSIVASKRVAVVRNESSHQLELPDRLVLRLSGDPNIAAPELDAALETDWKPDDSVRAAWVRDFREKNEGFAGNLLAAIANFE